MDFFQIVSVPERFKKCREKGYSLCIDPGKNHLFAVLISLFIELIEHNHVRRSCNLILTRLNDYLKNFQELNKAFNTLMKARTKQEILKNINKDLFFPELLELSTKFLKPELDLKNYFELSRIFNLRILIIKENDEEICVNNFQYSCPAFVTLKFTAPMDQKKSPWVLLKQNLNHICLKRMPDIEKEELLYSINKTLYESARTAIPPGKLDRAISLCSENYSEKYKQLIVLVPKIRTDSIINPQFSTPRFRSPPESIKPPFIPKITSFNKDYPAYKLNYIPILNTPRSILSPLLPDRAPDISKHEEVIKKFIRENSNTQNKGESELISNPTKEEQGFNRNPDKDLVKDPSSGVCNPLSKSLFEPARVLSPEIDKQSLGDLKKSSDSLENRFSLNKSSVVVETKSANGVSPIFQISDIIINSPGFDTKNDIEKYGKPPPLTPFSKTDNFGEDKLKNHPSPEKKIDPVIKSLDVGNFHPIESKENPNAPILTQTNLITDSFNSKPVPNIGNASSTVLNPHENPSEGHAQGAIINSDKNTLPSLIISQHPPVLKLDQIPPSIIPPFPGKNQFSPVLNLNQSSTASKIDQTPPSSNPLMLGKLKQDQTPPSNIPPFVGKDQAIPFSIPTQPPPALNLEQPPPPLNTPLWLKKDQAVPPLIHNQPFPIVNLNQASQDLKGVQIPPSLNIEQNLKSQNIPSLHPVQKSPTSEKIPFQNPDKPSLSPPNLLVSSGISENKFKKPTRSSSRPPPNLISNKDLKKPLDPPLKSPEKPIPSPQPPKLPQESSKSPDSKPPQLFQPFNSTKEEFKSANSPASDFQLPLLELDQKSSKDLAKEPLQFNDLLSLNLNLNLSQTPNPSKISEKPGKLPPPPLFQITSSDQLGSSRFSDIQSPKHLLSPPLTKPSSLKNTKPPPLLPFPDQVQKKPMLNPTQEIKRSSAQNFSPCLAEESSPKIIADDSPITTNSELPPWPGLPQSSILPNKFLASSSQYPNNNFKNISKNN